MRAILKQTKTGAVEIWHRQRLVGKIQPTLAGLTIQTVHGNKIELTGLETTPAKKAKRTCAPS